MNNTFGYETFIKALKDLDSEIDEDVEIRVIGGFGIILNGKFNDKFLPMRETSRDVDSVTKEYSKRILKAIKKVGKKNNIDYNWLNTDWNKHLPDDNIKEIIEWQELDLGLNNIKLKYADLESLFHYKMRALGDLLEAIRYPVPTVDPRNQLYRGNDIRDIISILKYYNEDDIYNLKNIRIKTNISNYDLACMFIDEYIELN